ncbi:MAG: hypothetical protein JSW13_04395 [Candidatus Aerophobus sp.]|nr:MAG: hypothetical protein JSW13_04395 [Candidatus Aerophobus sp.]
MLLEKTTWTSMFYLGYKERLTEETGFPMVEVAPGSDFKIILSSGL